MQAETLDGLTRWSPYGRFYTGSDAAVDAFRAEREAEELETRKQVACGHEEKEARLDPMPWVERDDTIPSRVEAGSLGIDDPIGPPRQPYRPPRHVQRVVARQG